MNQFAEICFGILVYCVGLFCLAFFMKHIQEERDPLFAKAVRRLQQLKKDLTAERPSHVCSRAVCNPQNEEGAGPLGRPAEAFTSNVYLCKYGTIHVCSELSCGHYGHSPTQTCHISGIQYGNIVKSYDKNDSRTYGSQQEIDVSNRPFELQLGEDGEGIVKRMVAPPAVAPPKKHIHHKKMSADEIKEQAEDLVKLLLYSKHRSECNKAAAETNRAEGADAVATYIKQQEKARQQPFATDEYRLYAHYCSRPPPLLEFRFDPAKHAYYASIIVQMWAKVMKYYVPPDEKRFEEDGVTPILPRINFQSVGLGVLYAMRKGLRHQDVEILPKDQFLEDNLPQLAVLPLYFNLSRKLTTLGDSVLAKTFENAFRSNAPITDLMLNAEEIGGAGPQGRQKRGRKKAKIAESGEQIYALKSRNKKNQKK